MPLAAGSVTTRLATAASGGTTAAARARRAARHSASAAAQAGNDAARCHEVASVTHSRSVGTAARRRRRSAPGMRAAGFEPATPAL